MTENAQAQADKEAREIELIGRKQKTLAVLRECCSWVLTACITALLILAQMLSVGLMELSVLTGEEHEPVLCTCRQHWFLAAIIIAVFIACTVIFHLLIYKSKEKKRLKLRFFAAAAAYTLFQAASLIWYGYPNFQGVTGSFVTLLCALYTVCALYPLVWILVYFFIYLKKKSAKNYLKT
jgi:hypothetical protein